MTTVRTRPRTPGRVRPGLLAPAVVALVLGILGMHGVDAHGVNLHGVMAHAETGTRSVAAIPTMPAMPAVPAGEVAGEHGDVHSPTVAAGDAGGTSSMVMLCVAMLAGAAAGLLALLVRRGRPNRLRAVMRPARRVWRPGPHPWRAGTGPPYVWRFSVIRC